VVVVVVVAAAAEVVAEAAAGEGVLWFPIFFQISPHRIQRVRYFVFF
jgi:hypothetical protein